MSSIHLFRPVISEAAIEAVSEVLRSGWTGLGPKTKQFEEDFAKFVGAKYCVGLNSCTSALHLALHLLDLKEGDEVITTPLTFVSTNHAILYVRATPVFADVQLSDGNLDPDDVESKITEKTKAILLVHYGGNPCEMDRFHEIGRTYNIPIIEDCAHAAGSRYEGKRIGSISSLNCFSFHSVKNLSIGDGGAITTNNKYYYERLLKLRWLGIDKSTFTRTEMAQSNLNPKAYAWKYGVPEVGFKYHMNDIMAAIGIEQLKLLWKENERRKEIADIYSQLFHTSGVIGFLRTDGSRNQSSHHICAVRTERRDALMDKLKSYDIHPGVHYLRNDYYPMYKTANLPNAEKLQNELISLPLHLALTEGDIQRVIGAIKSGW